MTHFVNINLKGIQIETKNFYQKALEKSGFRQNLKYHPANKNFNNNKRNRKRNVIWLNPPFSANIKTKFGNYFLNLIGKHFRPRHKFNKLFNRNTIKVATATCQILKPKYTKAPRKSSTKTSRYQLCI